MVKIKKGDLFNARDVIMNKMWLGEYREIPDDEILVMKTVGTLLELVKASNDLTERRKEILNKHGKKNKHGTLIVENDSEGKGVYKVISEELFNEEIKRLFDEEIEIEGLVFAEIQNMNLCPAEINAISFLFA